MPLIGEKYRRSVPMGPHRFDRWTPSIKSNEWSIDFRFHESDDGIDGIDGIDGRSEKGNEKAKKKSARPPALNAWVPLDSLDVAVDVTVSRARPPGRRRSLSRI